MRILHVATLVSADGAYGGPVRVATNICKQIMKQGSQAELWAAAGYGMGSVKTFDGTPVRLFAWRKILPWRGFAPTWCPTMPLSLISARKELDVLHIHLGRDAVTMPMAIVARAFGIPYIVQTHGMIKNKNGAFFRLFDTIFTRPVLRGAASVLHLTNYEKQRLLEVEPRIRRLDMVPNGVDVPEQSEPTSNEGPCRVLFMARLHKRKRPTHFIRAAIILSRGNVNATFHVAGPDEGEQGVIRELIEGSRCEQKIVYEGAIEPGLTSNRILNSDVYVLPSINEPFPMSVIEAMAAAKPVVITNTCGLARYVEEAGAGIVVDSTVDDLVSAMEKLIRDGDLRGVMGQNAKRLVAEKLNIKDVGLQVEKIYDDAIGTRGSE